MKVHAQRKFAQGSIISNNVSPYKEDQFIPSFVIPKLQNISSKNSANTDDFLNFLCFRGTSLLPPKLAHFNTSSTTDEDIHPENLKGSNSKNGPIITSMCKNIGEIADSFIAFGVRKRADPIITSRQMDRKRKHALALQDLRRKYQEQKMAKIRAITISKLSEKTSNRILDVKLKPNCIPKNDVPKKMANKNPSKVSSTHLEVPKINIKSLVPKIDSKMCLRSCRTSFVQQELLSVRIKPCKKSIQRDGTKRLKNLQQKVISTKCEVRKYSLRRCHAVRNCERITRSNALRKASNKTRPSIKFKSAFTKQRILRSNAFKDQKLLQNKHESNLVNVNSTATSTVNDIKDTLKDSQSVPIVRPDILNKKILTKETQKNFSNKSKIKMIVERPNLKTKPLKKLKKNFQITNKSIKPEECETEVLKKQDIPFKRPSRKTKEAATIYMEILSQKLVNEYRIDGEDDISIDSFPELPNVKKTTQRENELKAKVINNKKVSPQIGESRPKNKLFKVKNQIKRKSVSGKNILIKKKITESFSDSDEEPLSKLTNKNKNEEQESKIVKTKPKRECAKLPQNYLLMSSSSDEDIFSDRYIYAESPKPTKQKQKSANVKLLSKEILMSPKTRVNMSKEQIEKWLTESLTPEKVPYKEDSSCNSFCDYNYELKKVLEDSKGDITNKKNNDDTDVCSKSEGKKPILRKTKNTKECSVGAFSAFNESSVYAFGEENETKISTPFRHTPRRSSIGNTSKSDNGDSSKAKKNI